MLEMFMVVREVWVKVRNSREREAICEPLFRTKLYEDVGVHLAPTHLHEAAIKNVEEAVWDKTKAEVPDYPKVFV
jgi:hypothetical protein